MKVYISVDMEGVACATAWDDVRLGDPAHEKTRRWMTAEANAAIKGALGAGATEVIVCDSHGSMRNILPDELHEDALLVRGGPRPLIMMEGIDETCDAAFFVGYHAAAGSAKGVMSHTGILPVYALRLNGLTVGELGLNAAIAGHFGVPVALVCGDDALHAEGGTLIPWAERVITKWAISPHAARNLTPKASQKRIHEGANRALGRLSEMKPLVLEKPIHLEVNFTHPIHMDLVADIPGAERIDGRTLAYTGSDMLEVTRTFRLALNLARASSSSGSI